MFYLTKYSVKLNLLQLKLECVDKDYERIMNDIDNHTKTLDQKIRNGQFDVPIDSPSLRLYLLDKFGDIPDFKPRFGSVNDTDVMDQLHAMGINTIAELEKIVPENFNDLIFDPQIYY